MRIDIATLFPELMESYLSASIIGRARDKGIFTAECHNIRDYAFNKHRRVDDTPYSERQGMLMQAEPIYRCWQAVCDMQRAQPHVIYMSPQGQTLTQQKCIELSKKERLFILCGHYEGVDNRIIEKIVDEEISIGDYVLTGGELPALVLVDSVARMLDGVLAEEDGFMDESHYNGLLEYPQYTRPEVWQGMAVPPLLLSGHHANIAKWRHEQRLLTTLKKRPELLDKLSLSKEDLAIIHKAVENEQTGKT